MKDKNNLSVDAMGGNRKRIELLSCDEWKDKPKAWAVLEMAKMIEYMERIVGKNCTVTRIFKKNWKYGKITIGGRKVEIKEGMITKVTGMLMGGRNFYRDSKLTKVAIKRLPKEESEKTNLVKSRKTYYSLKVIKKIWRWILFVVMQYVVNPILRIAIKG